MKKINKDKLFKGIISISVIGAMLLLLSIPFIPGFNYSPLNVLGVEITPTQEYRIQFDLPHIKPITPEVRQKAETHLSKLFGITQSSLKNGTLLSKPFVDIKELPITNSYIGSIKIGNATIPFSKLKKQFNEVSKDNVLPSKELLTAYFRVNGKPLRANIFIMSKGSVLQYASMTLQDKDDNVPAMFTYGRALSKDNGISSASGNTSPSLNMQSTTSESSTNRVFKVRKFYTKYITISDPLNSAPDAYTPSLRSDALSEEPFAHMESGKVGMRTFGFQSKIANTYANFYKHAYHSGWAFCGIYKLRDDFRMRYQADVILSTGVPSPEQFYTSPINISFTLWFLHIDYPIYVSGEQAEWHGYQFAYPGWNSAYRNAAYHIVYTPSPYSSETFNHDWNSSIEWPVNDYSYNTLEYPDSSYKGYSAYIRFNNSSEGDDNLYGDFISTIYYSIKAGSGALYDWYFITVTNNYQYVKLND